MEQHSNTSLDGNTKTELKTSTKLFIFFKKQWKWKLLGLLLIVWNVLLTWQLYLTQKMLVSLWGDFITLIMWLDKTGMASPLTPNFYQTIKLLMPITWKSDVYNLDDEQIKDLLQAELDVLQFLDLLGMTFRELIDMVFDQGITEEQRDWLMRHIR